LPQETEVKPKTLHPGATASELLAVLRHNASIQPTRIADFMSLSPDDRDELLFRLCTSMGLEVSRQRLKINE